MTGPAPTLYRLLADNLPLRADKTALVDPGHSVTYAELSDQVDRVAARLWQEGVRPGDRVVIQLRKSLAEVAAMFGAWKIGAVVVNANAALTQA
ncbi:MAG TPA: AMP-binding protein, partial [Paracoccus sp. (in: a-proteobacteria)]|nr:AMP-binding protein [Paracoccus sp. (in: a-proteobacteria)]